MILIFPSNGSGNFIQTNYVEREARRVKKGISEREGGGGREVREGRDGRERVMGKIRLLCK